MNDSLKAFSVPSLAFLGGIAIALAAGWLYFGVVTCTEATQLSGEPQSFVQGTWRVVWYKQMVQHDPIFGLPGTDLERFLEETENIAAAGRYLALAFPDEPEKAAWFSDGVYPTEFHKQLAETERLRRLVVTEPTRQHIAEYHQSLMVTLSLHRTFLEKLITFTEQVEKPDQQYGFWGGTTDFQTAGDRLKTLVTLNEIQQHKAESRWQCLSGWYFVCESPTAAASVLLDRIATDSGVRRDTDLANRAVMEENWQYYQFHSAPTLDPNSVPLEEVYVLEQNYCSFDTGTQQFAFLSYPVYPFHNVTPFTKVERVDDLFLHKTVEHYSPYMRHLYGFGQVYQAQTFNAYLCLDGAEAAATVWTLHDLREAITATRISEQLGVSETEADTALKSALATMEESLLNAKTIHQADIVMYLQATRSLVKESGFALTPELTQTIRDWHLLYHSRTAHTEDVFAWVRLSFSSMIPMSLFGVDSIQWQNFFMGMWRIDTTLLTYNQWLYPDFSFFNANTIEASRDKPVIYSFQNEVKNEVSIAELMRMQQIEYQRTAELNQPYYDVWLEAETTRTEIPE